MPSRLLRALVLAAVVAGVAAPPAGAVGWVTGPPLSPAGSVATSPMVALTPSGERVVAWDRASATPGVSAGLAVRVAAPGDDFGPSQLIGASDMFPSLTSGDDGTVALVWVTPGLLHIARLDPGQTGFAEATPATLAAAPWDPPKVVVHNGEVFAAVDTASSTATTVTTSIRAFHLAAGATAVAADPGPGPGGVLDQVILTTTDPLNEVLDAHIAVDAGTVHIVWQQLADAPAGQTARTLIWRAQHAIGGGPFSSRVLVDTVTSATRFAPEAGPVIAARDTGAQLAWLDRPGQKIATLALAPGAAKQTIALTAAPSNLFNGVDQAGEQIAAWQTPRPDATSGIFTSIVPAVGAPGPVASLTPPGADREIDALAVAADGSALEVSDRVEQDEDSADEQIQAAFRAPGAAFGALEEVSGPQDRSGVAKFDPATAAVGAGGRALVAWSADDHSGVPNERIFLSERDATPPVLGVPAVSPTATTASPVAFAVDATDALSPVAVGWDFGDGSHAAGASVTHAYGAPGTYTVTVTASDSSANVATRTTTITVTTPPARSSSGTGTGPGTGTTPDSTAPVLTHLTSTNRRFRIGTPATALVAAHRHRPARPPSGTTFRLHVSERSTLVIALSGRIAGRRAGSHCVAGRRTGRPCTIAASPGILVRTAQGPDDVAIAFSGRVAATRLAPGSYTASVTAIDAAGNRSRPATVPFTVVAG